MKGAQRELVAGRFAAGIRNLSGQALWVPCVSELRGKSFAAGSENRMIPLVDSAGTRCPESGAMESWSFTSPTPANFASFTRSNQISSRESFSTRDKLNLGKLSAAMFVGNKPGGLEMLRDFDAGVAGVGKGLQGFLCFDTARLKAADQLPNLVFVEEMKSMFQEIVTNTFLKSEGKLHIEGEGKGGLTAAWGDVSAAFCERGSAMGC